MTCKDIIKGISIDPVTFEYTIELTSNTYLYKHGEEYNGLTGGWILWTYNGSGTQNTKTDNYMQIYIPNIAVAGGAVTKNQITLSKLMFFS